MKKQLKFFFTSEDTIEEILESGDSVYPQNSLEEAKNETETSGDKFIYEVTVVKKYQRNGWTEV